MQKLYLLLRIKNTRRNCIYWKKKIYIYIYIRIVPNILISKSRRAEHFGIFTFLLNYISIAFWSISVHSVYFSLFGPINSVWTIPVHLVHFSDALGVEFCIKKKINKKIKKKKTCLIDNYYVTFSDLSVILVSS